MIDENQPTNNAYLAGVEQLTAENLLVSVRHLIFVDNLTYDTDTEVETNVIEPTSEQNNIHNKELMVCENQIIYQEVADEQQLPSDKHVAIVENICCKEHLITKEKVNSEVEASNREPITEQKTVFTKELKFSEKQIFEEELAIEK